MPAALDNSVIVALSGGVDSAVAASLLIERGFAVQGLYMSNWEEDESGYCTSAEDFQDARRVADQLGIALHRVNFAREYRERVFAHFLAECRAGRTPNPDVLCNREIKFGVCYGYARRLGAHRFATGHYARVGQAGAEVTLLRAADASKDQTYFLHAIDPGVLEHVVFPLGDLRKTEVRAYARAHAFAVHDKKDSTGICFIGERPFADFLRPFLPARPGPIETIDGEAVGTHLGLMYYTLGQRQGLGIGGRRGGSVEPWYVAAKDLERNALVIVQGPNHPGLLSGGLETEPMHWLTNHGLPRRDLQAQIRHRQSPVACSVMIGKDGSATIRFREPQRAVTPGQFAVLYDDGRCLGGAAIRRAIPVAQARSPIRASA